MYYLQSEDLEELDQLHRHLDGLAYLLKKTSACIQKERDRVLARANGLRNSVLPKVNQLPTVVLGRIFEYAAFPSEPLERRYGDSPFSRSARHLLGTRRAIMGTCAQWESVVRTLGILAPFIRITDEELRDPKTVPEVHKGSRHGGLRAMINVGADAIKADEGLKEAVVAAVSRASLLAYQGRHGLSDSDAGPIFKASRELSRLRKLSIRSKSQSSSAYDLSGAPLLEDLWVSHAGNDAASLQLQISPSSVIRRLGLTGEISPISMPNIINNCLGIEILSIDIRSRPMIPPREVRLPFLQRLSLSHHGIAHLPLELLDAPNLEHLSIEFVGQDLGEALGCTRLRELTISCHQLWWARPEVLVSFLAFVPTVEHLILDFDHGMRNTAPCQWITKVLHRPSTLPRLQKIHASCSSRRLEDILELRQELIVLLPKELTSYPERFAAYGPRAQFLDTDEFAAIKARRGDWAEVEEEWW